MEFLFLCSTFYLCSLVRYQVEHSKRHSISMRTPVLSSVYLVEIFYFKYCSNTQCTVYISFCVSTGTKTSLIIVKKSSVLVLYLSQNWVRVTRKKITWSVKRNLVNPPQSIWRHVFSCIPHYIFGVYAYVFTYRRNEKTQEKSASFEFASFNNKGINIK